MNLLIFTRLQLRRWFGGGREVKRRKARTAVVQSRKPACPPHRSQRARPRVSVPAQHLLVLKCQHHFRKSKEMSTGHILRLPGFRELPCSMNFLWSCTSLSVLVCSATSGKMESFMFLSNVEENVLTLRVEYLKRRPIRLVVFSFAVIANISSHHLTLFAARSARKPLKLTCLLVHVSIKSLLL